MSEPEPVRYSPSWLGLRERADARARARELIVVLAGELAEIVAGGSRLVIHDLGCGTGSMGRWLAPLLPGPQHWVLHDRDPDLLDLAAARMPVGAAGGKRVSVEVRPGDLTRLTASDLSGAALVTGSALLDLLTREEVDQLAADCAEVGCAALFTLSVVGRVELAPGESLDRAVGAAFNAHQRRVVSGRRLLGPDALAAATDAFTRQKAIVDVRPSPWRLAPGESELAMEWLRGWAGAAGEQRPGLGVEGYLARRLAAAASGKLHVTVHHGDILARWERTVSRPASYQST